MVAAAPTQDMPPPGGYAPLSYKRVPARTYFRGWHWFAGFLATKAVGIYLYLQYKKRNVHMRVEDRSAFHAIQPLLFAEQARGHLRQLIKNREEEAELMKNVPGWEIGKYYDEPLFKTLKNDQWIDTYALEYFAHRPHYEFKNSVFFDVTH